MVRQNGYILSYWQFFIASRAHTAVKIAPRYSQTTVHVLDASKSVVVVNLYFTDTILLTRFQGFCK